VTVRIIIASRIYRPEPAAASFYLGAVADALVAAGHEVDVITVRPPRGLRAASRGERIRMFPVLRDRSGYVRGYVQYLSFDVPLALRLLFAKRPDAVFVEPPPTTGAVVRVVCAIRRIPYVYDAADLWSDAATHATGSGLVVRVLRALERFAMRGATSLVTISQGVVDRARELGIARPFTVTGFGADTSEFSYLAADREPLFVYAGTYSELHGAGVLVDAFARFLRAHPGYILRFIGNGTERQALDARAAALGIADAVEFLDPLPAGELGEHLARATASLATLLPGGSYEYAFTSKAYSSLAVGCPVIFAGPGPTGPFIEGANAVVRAGVAVGHDADAIAEAMGEFADRPPSSAERRAVAEWTESEHSLRAVASRVALVIEDAATARGAGGPGADGTGADGTGASRAGAELGGVPGPVRSRDAGGPGASGAGTDGDPGSATPASPAPTGPGLAARLADWAVRHRSKMPRWVGRLMESAARNPDGLVGRLSARVLGGGGEAPVTTVPDAPTRVYIAPTNYSGQGYLWARSLERARPGVGARNMAIQLPGGFAFPADTLVPIAAVNASSEWAAAEWAAARQFTHVLVEAERPMFGREFGRSLEAEIAALRAAGVSVAMLCHGTDVRDPDRHRELTRWSPYPEDPRTDTLRRDAHENVALLERLGLPTFISTPDLAADVPWAAWCPVVVDAARFATDAPAFARDRPRVIHASSNPVQKGSHLIEPALAPLVDAGRIDVEFVTSTPASEMPGVFAGADIVLDQFRLGSYGVAACEAMAAGRVVVGHVLPAVRERVERDFGIALPIVEATPDTLREVVGGLVADPDRARAIASAGPGFVERVHTGAASADALLAHWIDA